MLGPLTFTDPREVAAYWDRFEDRSVKPIQPYLWVFPEDTAVDPDDSESPTITPIRREELDMMVVDKDRELIKVDPALYVFGQNVNGTQHVLVLSDKDREDSDSGWVTELVLVLQNKIEAENFLKQLAGEIAKTFSVVE
ncbi:hypothetical protein SEA_PAULODIABOLI_184 [Microbacterium phage PauloDiaboli]|nr:hypothetical protein SEA_PAULODIABOLI_184 [Microbacterium phage PauloDiaboli]QWY83995.1 hypothetical protein SEA_A3WALLY_185 [Microbacterium phage A3Wally]